MKKSLLKFSGLLLVILLINCNPRQSKPVNIIFFIGDGMGVSHVTAGKTCKGVLALEKFKHLGLITTHSANKYVTDSAAGVTALATGNKTNNHRISMSPTGVYYKTILEYAKEAGMATGLVSTCAVTHATPAGFVSHVDSRYKYNEIAVQIAASGVDVLFGGGLGYFLPQSADSSLRKDDLDLISGLKKTYNIITDVSALASIDPAKKTMGLFYRNHPPVAGKRSYNLAKLTSKAVELLSHNKKGFFLMVEGSQIDWEGHANNSEGIITEMIDFDDAVAAGYEFAAKNNETLIVVTADHETGGYGLNNGSITNKQILEPGFTTGHHTGTMVPLFAFGPAANLFEGIQDNTDVAKNIINLIRN